MLHGECVAVGVITQLLMENNIEEAKKCIYFFKDVGLPFSYHQLKIDTCDMSKGSTLDLFTTAMMGKEIYFRDNEPFPVTRELVLKTVQKVDQVTNMLFPKIVQLNIKSNSTLPANGITADVKEADFDDNKNDCKIIFEITGFGKFADVTDNPSQRLIENLRKAINDNSNNTETGKKKLFEPNVVIGSLTVLDCIGKKVLAAVDKIRKNNAKTYPITGNDKTDTRDKVVYIHTGVDGFRNKCHLETNSRNEATFRAPDESGWQPKNELILKENGSLNHRYYTRIDTEKVVKQLQLNKHNCAESDNVGLYLCNYVYYYQLHQCSLSKNRDNEHALFVHIPKDEIMDEATVFKFFVDTINQIAKVLSE